MASRLLGLRVMERYRWGAVAAIAVLGACHGETMSPAPRLTGLAVRLAPTDTVLALDTTRATVVGLDQYGAPYSIGPATWGVMDSAVATIDADGLVHAMVDGSTTVVARAGGLSASVPLVVAGVRHASAILASETWSVAASPHVVIGRLAVGAPQGVILTIESGATVRFEQHAGLDFGVGGPGRLVVSGAATTTLASRLSDQFGLWFGLTFRGPGQSTLQHVMLQDCGETQPGFMGCLVIHDSVPGPPPTILIDSVTIEKSGGTGLILEGNAQFAPGSRFLSIIDVQDHLATLRARNACAFPLGGRLDRLTSGEVWLLSDTVTQSCTWGPIDARWHVLGSVLVEGAQNPLLTLVSDTFVFSSGAGILVGQGAPGGLRTIGTAAAPVVLDAPIGAEWGGLQFGPGTLPSSLTQTSLNHGAGGYAPYGISAVFLIGDFAGKAPAPVFDSVRISGSSSAAITAIGGGYFGAGSHDLTITGNGIPLILEPNVVWSIPPGSYTGNQDNAIELWNEQVTVSQTWAPHGVPYSVPYTLAIEDSTNPTLTLEAGTVIRFADNGELRVGLAAPGGLRVLGDSAAPVVLTNQTTPSHPGLWTGIVIGDSADASTVIQYAIVELAGGAADPPQSAIRVAHDYGPIIHNVLIRQSASCGILRMSGTPWVTDFTTPQLGNQFVGNTGPDQCGP